MSATSILTPRGLVREMTRADFVACAVVLLAGFSSLGLLRAASPSSEVEVLLGDEVVHRLSLSEASTVTVDGRLGPVVVVVEDGAVRVAQSGCPNRICVAMGAKRRAGEVVACVPNALFLRLTGDAAPDVPDAVSR